MISCEGIVDLVEGETVHICVRYDGEAGVVHEGTAEIPLSAFPPEQQSAVTRGRIIECELDNTLLVTSVRAVGV